MKTMFLAEDEKLLDVLEEIYRNGSALKTLVWFDESVESQFFTQARCGSLNAPYMGVKMRGFESKVNGIVKIYYKKEKRRINEDIPPKTDELYLVKWLKISEEFCFFGACPEEEIIIKRKKYDHHQKSHHN